MSIARDRRKDQIKMQKQNLQNAAMEMQRKAIETSTPFFCACKCPFFIKALRLRRVSPLYTKDGEAKLFPIETIVCLNCAKEAYPDEQENLQKNSVPEEGRNVEQDSSWIVDKTVEEQ